MGARWSLHAREGAIAQVTALIDGSGPGILVVSGPPGVGRTRLAAEAHAAAHDAGLRSVRALATRAASQIPLGAFVGLVGEVRDGPGHLARVRERLLGAPHEPPLLLTVDDAHLLDDVSATLVLSLAGEANVRLLVTVPTGSTPPDAITALWKDLDGARLTLDPLGRSAVAGLLEAVLGGPVTSSAVDAFVEASGGLLLNLRELVDATRRSGQLAMGDGVWDVRGKLLPGDHLRDLIAARLDELDDASRLGVQVLALVQPVHIDLLDHLCGPGVSSRLESREIIRVHHAVPSLDDRAVPTSAPTPVLAGLGRAVLTDPGTGEAQLANPLYGEVALVGTDARARGRLLSRCADALEAGVAQVDDPLRVALWRLRSGDEPDAVKLLDAAHRAYLLADYPRVLELAEAAWERRPDGVAGHLLGFALGRAGRCEEAETVLAAASALVDDDRLRTFVALARAENLQRGLGELDAAIEVCCVAEAQLREEAWRDEVCAHRAMIVLQRGDLAQAHRLLEPIIERGPAVAPRAFAKAAYAFELVLLHRGRFDATMALSQTALPVHEEVWELDVFQTEPAVHHLSALMALSMSGRFLEADLLGQAALELTRRGNPRYAFAWMSYLVGQNDLAMGRVATARRHFLDAVPIFREGRQAMVARWCLAAAAQCSALLGDRDAAASHLHAAQRGEHLELQMNKGQVADAIGWVTQCSGEPDKARAWFDTEADLAIEAGDLVNALRLLHSLVRCGGAVQAVERLDLLAESVDGDLAPAVAGFAHALGAHDAAACEAAADRFEALGAILAAAEAAAAAARNHARDGETRRAASANRRHGDLLARCEGASTPLTWRSATIAPLSRREHEVARLAAEGVPSKAIAARLSISPRTVDNHLQRVYTKLGVTARADLAAALAGASSPPSP